MNLIKGTKLRKVIFIQASPGVPKNCDCELCTPSWLINLSKSRFIFFNIIFKAAKTLRRAQIDNPHVFYFLLLHALHKHEVNHKFWIENERSLPSLEYTPSATSSETQYWSDICPGSFSSAITSWIKKRACTIQAFQLEILFILKN